MVFHEIHFPFNDLHNLPASLHCPMNDACASLYDNHCTICLSLLLYFKVFLNFTHFSKLIISGITFNLNTRMMYIKVCYEWISFFMKMIISTPFAKGEKEMSNNKNNFLLNISFIILVLIYFLYYVSISNIMKKN